MASEDSMASSTRGSMGLAPCFVAMPQIATIVPAFSLGFRQKRVPRVGHPALEPALPLTKNEHRPQQGGMILDFLLVPVPNALQVIEIENSVSLKQSVVGQVPQFAAKPLSDGHTETHLAARKNRGGQHLPHRFLENVLTSTSVKLQR